MDERLSFILARPAFFHSYRQLSELFREFEKQYVKFMIKNKNNQKKRLSQKLRRFFRSIFIYIYSVSWFGSGSGLGSGSGVSTGFSFFYRSRVSGIIPAPRHPLHYCHFRHPCCCHYHYHYYHCCHCHYCRYCHYYRYCHYCRYYLLLPFSPLLFLSSSCLSSSPSAGVSLFRIFTFGRIFQSSRPQYPQGLPLQQVF